MAFAEQSPCLLGALQTYKNGASRGLGKKSPDFLWALQAWAG